MQYPGRAMIVPKLVGVDSRRLSLTGKLFPGPSIPTEEKGFLAHTTQGASKSSHASECMYVQYRTRLPKRKQSPRLSMCLPSDIHASRVVSRTVAPVCDFDKEYGCLHGIINAIGRAEPDAAARPLFTIRQYKAHALVTLQAQHALPYYWPPEHTR